jgi:hypothetical protein
MSKPDTYHFQAFGRTTNDLSVVGFSEIISRKLLETEAGWTIATAHICRLQDDLVTQYAVDPRSIKWTITPFWWNGDSFSHEDVDSDIN